MSKMMGGLIAAIDGFMPGYKTYICWVVAMTMMVCQMMGYHHFTPEITIRSIGNRKIVILLSLRLNRREINT